MASSSTTTRTDSSALLSDSIRFYDFAGLLERLGGLSKNADKLARLKSYVAKCREKFRLLHGTLESERAGGDSLFPIFRILLSQRDRDRKAYNLKAPTLGKLLADILALNQEDRLKLTKYRESEAGSSDFASVFATIVKKRFSENEGGSELTLTQVHDALDRIAWSKDGSTSQAEQKKVFLELFVRGKLSSLEGKWLVRVILKNLELGLSRTAVMKLLHPQAEAAYERMADFKQLCQKLNDENASVDLESIQLFCYVKPMLCLRVDSLDDFDSKGEGQLVPSEGPRSKRNARFKNVSTVMNPPFVVETKWDGERFQIHYEDGTFKVLSKQVHDFTTQFNLTLTPKLALQLKKGVKSFIIDGEMMAWNKKYNLFTQKGAEIDVKRLRQDNPNHVPVFVAFDVLYYNGEMAINKPLHQRYKILQKIITPKDDVVIIAEQKVVNTKEEVELALNSAIDNMEEGLIVKAYDSVYEPGVRGLSWRKIKPEFIFGTSVTDLDLLIIGAYYSETTRRSGQIAHFLVGVIDTSGGKEEFFAVAQVGSGRLRSPEMEDLVQQLSKHFQKKEFPGIQYKARKKPDLYINPKDSIVLQVKASEMNRSSYYALGYTLRFPRVTKTRRDKNYNQIMTKSEFFLLLQNTGGKLAKRTDASSSPVQGTSGQQNTNAARPVRRSARNRGATNDDALQSVRDASLQDKGNLKMAVISPSKLSLQARVPVIKDLFESQEYCVYISNETVKRKLENDIQSYGGEIVQNPVNTKVIIVGDNEKYLKISRAIKSGKYDVLKATFIQNCVEQKEKLPVTPADFYFHTAETFGSVFKNQYDEDLDSYTKPLSMEETKSLVKRVLPKLDENEEIDREELDEELFPKEKRRKIEGFRFFNGVKAAFREYTDPSLAGLVQFYGGEVAEGEEEDGVTHIIVKDPLSPSKLKCRNQLSAFIVLSKWVQDCVQQRRCLDELRYSAEMSS